MLMPVLPIPRKRRNNVQVIRGPRPVPPAELRVVSVTLELMMPNIVYWEFSMDIADPVSVAGLTAAEMPGMYWTRESPRRIYVEYSQNVWQGQNWQATAGAVEGVDGTPLTAAMGSVE